MVFSTESVRNNENVMLHFKMEKPSPSMTGLARDSQDKVYMSSVGYAGADQKYMYPNFTPPGTYAKYVNQYRDVSAEEVESQTLDVIPGFRVSWWYTGEEVTPDPQYKDDDMTKHLVR